MGNDEIKSEVKVELKELMKSTGIKSHIEDMSQKVENLSFDDFYNKIADEVDAIEFNKLENQKDKIDELKSLTKDFLKEKFEKLEEIREDEDGAMKERVENKAEQYGEKVDDWSDKLIDIGQREFQELLEGENGDKIEHGIEFAKGSMMIEKDVKKLLKMKLGRVSIYLLT